MNGVTPIPTNLKTHRTIQLHSSGHAVLITDNYRDKFVTEIVITRRDSSIVRNGIRDSRNPFLTGRVRCGVLNEGGRIEVACFVDRTSRGGVLSLGKCVEGEPKALLRLSADEVSDLEIALDRLEKTNRSTR